MKFMVGYDASESAKDALELSKKHAKAFGAEIHLVASMDKGTDTNLMGIEKIETALQYAQESVAEENIVCQQHLLIRGLTPGEDLVEYIRENDIDAVFLGIHRRSKIGKLLMGSTAQYVILEAPCPVITIR